MFFDRDKNFSSDSVSGLWNIKVEYNNVNVKRWNAALKDFYTVHSKIAHHIIGMDNLVNGMERSVEEIELCYVKKWRETISVRQTSEISI